MAYEILVVDDELDLRVLLTVLLKKAGYFVESASNGHEALEKIQNRRPQLIISDIRMPEGDGFELIEKVSQLPGPAIPVLFISGYADEHEGRLSRFSNFAGFLMKPVSWDRLQNSIQAIQSRGSAVNLHA